MDEIDIRVMLEMIVPRLAMMIMDKQKMDWKESLISLYKSELYHQLSREETKLWHLSVPTLYDMWDEERKTGHITYPEEA